MSVLVAMAVVAFGAVAVARWVGWNKVNSYDYTTVMRANQLALSYADLMRIRLQSVVANSSSPSDVANTMDIFVNALVQKHQDESHKLKASFFRPLISTEFGLRIQRTLVNLTLGVATYQIDVTWLSGGDAKNQYITTTVTLPIFGQNNANPTDNPIQIRGWIDNQ